MSETVTYTIVKIGTRWLDGVSPSGSRAKIHKNSTSRSFLIGETYTFSARLEEKVTTRTSKICVYPDTSEEYIMVVRGEPSGAFGPVRRQFISGQSLRNPDSEEQILTIVKECSRFVSEGGMALGIGDHEGWIHTAYCRLASHPEIASFLALEKECRSSHESKLELIEAWQHLRDIVREHNNLVQDKNAAPVLVTVQRLIRDTGFSKGHGELFGIDTSDCFWHVHNKNLRDPVSPNVIIDGQAGIGHRCKLEIIRENLTPHESDILCLNPCPDG